MKNVDKMLMISDFQHSRAIASRERCSLSTGLEVWIFCMACIYLSSLQLQLNEILLFYKYFGIWAVIFAFIGVSALKYYHFENFKNI